MPRELAELLKRVLEREGAELQKIGEAEAREKPDPGSWSRKEALGHLIDSATNNHVRFVRASLEPEMRGPKYDQEGWVALHGYNDLDWSALVYFWQSYNALLVNLVARIPAEKLATQCFIGDGAPATLGFVIEDYVLHIQHHIDHILRRPKLTEYPSAGTAL